MHIESAEVVCPLLLLPILKHWGGYMLDLGSWSSATYNPHNPLKLHIDPLLFSLSCLCVMSVLLSLCDVCTCSHHADINKFLWMVRIGGSTDKGKHIKEADYFTPQGEFRVDREGSPILLNCLMYKMCYYRFGQVYTEQGKHHLNPHPDLYLHLPGPTT